MGEWGWVIGAAGVGVSFLTFYGGWVAARQKGESAADAAKKAQETADQTARDLAAFKAEAAGRFATIEMLEKSENRVADAINRLADRLDRVLETTRPAPRTRATKP